MVTVTFDQGWLPYVLGAAKVLTANSTYDPLTPAEVAAATSAAYDLLRQIQEAVPFVPTPAKPPFSGFWNDDMQSLRQNPDNPCQLQVQCADGTWDTVFDASLCKPNLAPGGGTTPPAAGVCSDYEIPIDTHLLTLMPFVVNAGDTLQVVSASGAAADGPNWYCPDGEFFILGGCFGGAHTTPGDPVPTKPHMSLVWLINGVYYWASTTTPFTVPGGITNQQIWLGVNNSSLASVGGQERVKFTYCNNQTPTPGTWCHTANFLSVPDGYVPPIRAQTGVCGTPTQSEGLWFAGTGWEGSHETDLGCANPLRLALIRLDMGASVVITAANLQGNIPAGYTASQINVVVSTTADFSAGNTTLINSTTESGAYNLNFAGGPVTARYVQIYLQGNYVGAVAGELTSTSWKISGTGTPPPIGSNC